MTTTVINSKVASKATKLLDLFERQQTEERGVWYSFKSEVIGKDVPGYEELSDLIRNSDVDENTAYQWTVDCLEFLADSDSANNWLEEDSISEWVDSSVPVYNSDLLEWITQGINYTLVDESIEEMGKRDSLIADIQQAYYLALRNHLSSVINLVTNWRVK